MGFKFYLWRNFRNFSLIYPQNLASLLLLLVYFLFALGALYVWREDFQRLRLRGWIVCIVILLCILPANALLVVRRSIEGQVVASSVQILRSSPSLSLAAMSLLVGASVWLGIAPAVLVGLWMGLSQAWFSSLSLNDAFAFAAWAGLLGWFIHQPYEGPVFRWLRSPLVAVITATSAPLLLLSSNRLMDALPSRGLVAMEYATAPLRSAGFLWLGTTLLLGVALWLIFHLAPKSRPEQRADQISFLQRSLRVRFMVVILPLLLIGTLLSIVAVTRQAINVAREQALGEMARSASNAADGIGNFYYTGSNLLKEFASRPELWESDSQAEVLRMDLQVVPFFQELLLVDADGEIVAFAPDSLVDVTLTNEEAAQLERALSFNMSLSTTLTELSSGDRRMTFIQPVIESGREVPTAALLGRVQLSVNPNMRRALEALQLTRGVGTGFIVNDRNQIIAHPNPDALLRPWIPTTDALRSYSVESGRAYEDVGPEGERILVYVQKVVGGITVVMQLPFSAVLQVATRISNPLLYVQLLTGAGLALVVPVLATRITQPLHTLAKAANQISQGNLEIPVHISGADEVAQLGGAFEQMRQRLRDRLNDLSLLLRISQAVSATLDLEEGLPIILKGILEETQAATARFVLLGSRTYPRQVFSAGLSHAVFPGLDRALASALYRRREPLISQNLQQQDITPLLEGPLQSVAAFPVRTHDRTVAVLWVGSERAEAFDEARLNFLTTLVSQAAVLVENARLFQAAEGGRQRLSAILSSTTDAILVTDQEQNLLLVNPAAQRIFHLDELAYGRPLLQLELPDALKEALSEPFPEQQTPLTVEVPRSDGRIFLASVARVQATQSTDTLGRVAVMRDITYFKELDEMKSEFVATVSHDLRAPLTFIRGYATMLMMVGELNDKQHDYLDRILQGIEQMSALIDDLLNLRRIEAGVGIEQEPCRLGVVLVKAVDTMRARATAKGITLRLEPTEGSPTVVGDQTLLRQAIGNLVDNAIKYTPAGGQVSVGMEIKPVENEVVLHVTDTGIGIAQEDQLRLFEKFYRIKRRETGNIPGTGLGLALVKSIVGRHEGRVWVESKLNQGTTFYVALPLKIDDISPA